jgi:hypothetical protein
VAPCNVTINNMMPERIDTNRRHFMAQQAARREGITYERAPRR